MSLTKRNITPGATFALLGFSDYPELQAPLFLVFLAIYSFSIAGNFGMMVVIKVNPKLHTPMYFFLSHLSFVDFCYSSIIVPKMLVNLLAEDRTISFSGCMVQIFHFCTFVVTELILFAVMAYDHFVAICNPLLDTVVISQRLCHASGRVICMGSSLLLDSHLFCCQIIFPRFQHNQSLLLWAFFLDSPLLFWFLSQPVASFHSSTFNEVITLLIILTSYMFIVVTTLKMRSAGGHRKAFSTCASRLSATSAFHSTILSLSCVPNSKTSRHTVKVASVFHTVVIPMLNPLIYSLRNKDVKDTVSKLMKAKLYSHWRHVTAKYLLWLLDKTFLILNELCVKNSFKKSL